MKKFRILSREKLLDSKFFPLEKQTVEFPDGRKGEWFVKTSPDAVIVFPVLSSGEILLQRAYKHGGGEIVTEICAGLLDSGETPTEAAQRELREETGYKAKKFQKIGECFGDPTAASMRYHFFLATGCVHAGAQELDDSEQIEVFTVSDFTAAQTLLTSGKVHTSAATLAMLPMVESFFGKANKSTSLRVNKL